MFRMLPARVWHPLLLLLASAVLYLPNLGTPSLWDIDEGNNVEAAREMQERQDLVVPQFNYQLRVDKPALLYWLQIAAFRVFGVNEFAGRLPSALAATGAVLLVYVLGRRAMSASAGLLAALVLATATLFTAAAHFANPDALLNLFTTWTLFWFWRGVAEGQRSWFILAGISSGLAVLAKGPVGLVLPSAVAGLFLLWSGRLRLLLDRRLAWGALAFALVAVPWYALVGAETRLEWLKGFFLVHNLGRFHAPMEGHHGPVYYYVAVLILGLIPWSVFLGPAVWCSLRLLWKRGPAPAEAPEPVDFQRFLWCWLGVYLVFFSCSGTKLPNYILPAYAPVALLIGQFLDFWRRGEIALPSWVMNGCLLLLGLVGGGLALGLAIAAGVVSFAFMHGHYVPGVQWYGVLGAIPIVGALAAAVYVRAGRRNAAMLSLGLSAVALIGGLAAGGPCAVDRYKAPRPLAEALRRRVTEPDIRVGCYECFEPSLVFYCRREVARLETAAAAVQFLRTPLPAYVFVPATLWERMANSAPAACRLVDRHYDLYRNCDVMLISNR
ncbi:MAG TPA: glycosyltransferase family 39 protein [Gemmataceae bacterium]|nr:glycosyltransferase family 39 protein [Gemmataceae bacterium]